MRWKGGEQRNPKGRPKGAFNKITRDLKEALLVPFNEKALKKLAKTGRNHHLPGRRDRGPAEKGAGAGGPGPDNPGQINIWYGFGPPSPHHKSTTATVDPGPRPARRHLPLAHAGPPAPQRDSFPASPGGQGGRGRKGAAEKILLAELKPGQQAILLTNNNTDTNFFHDAGRLFH